MNLLILDAGHTFDTKGKNNTERIKEKLDKILDFKNN